MLLIHKYPNQVGRLIQRLSTKDTFFHVHLDLSVKDRSVFIKQLRSFNNVFLLSKEESHPVLWGDFSIIKATLSCINSVLSRHNESGYCILMSGQDYPIKNNRYIHEIFAENYGMNYISGYPLPSDLLRERGIDRIEKYNFHHTDGRRISYYPISDKRFYSASHILRLGYYMLITRKIKYFKKLFARKRQFPKIVSPYCGSQWFALPIETIKWVMEFINKHNEYLKYHQYTNIPDEIFFQSIIHSRIKSSLISDSVTYQNLRTDANPPHTFVSENFDELKKSPLLFARKFDMEFDCKILDEIDKHLLNV